MNAQPWPSLHSARNIRVDFDWNVSESPDVSVTGSRHYHWDTLGYHYIALHGVVQLIPSFYCNRGNSIFKDMFTRSQFPSK